MLVQAVVFDWGDTLMRDLPTNTGPMASWPRVEVVPGTRQALQALHGKYRLALATNADQSDSDQVRTALRRVGLDEFIDLIFTSKTIGLRKPTPTFYQAVLDGLNLSPGDAVMVGNNYRVDIEGASLSGLHAVWFNPDLQFPPTSHPRYNAEVSDMANLPAAIAGLRLPGVDECLRLIAEQGGGQRLVNHSQAVAGAAFRMAYLLREKGVEVDPLLAHRGGLLHDLDKLSARIQQRTHGELSDEILIGLGFPDLGAIARRHLISAALVSESAPITWEQKLVFYADKIAEEDSLVSVSERLQALRSRYPDYAGQFQQGGPIVLQLEADLCATLSLSPTELLSDLRKFQ
jgi:putative hydrolase of the HAD superfamily